MLTQTVIFRLTAGVKLKLLIMLVLSAGLLFSCAQIRKVTYPSDFVYLEKKEITSKMALLSLYMRQIDEVLLDDFTISSKQQADIVKILSSIETTVNELGAGSIRTNHLVIDDHIDQFKQVVTAAIRDASASPPNYFALGRLSGGCTGCHQYR